MSPTKYATDTMIHLSESEHTRQSAATTQPSPAQPRPSQASSNGDFHWEICATAAAAVWPTRLRMTPQACLVFFGSFCHLTITENEIQCWVLNRKL